MGVGRLFFLLTVASFNKGRFIINLEASVRVRKDPPSASIVIDRVGRRNALTKSMIGQIQQALDDFQQEKNVRAIIITGAGDFFSAGTDLHEVAIDMQHKDANGMLQLEVMRRWHEDIQAMHQVLEMMLRLPKPLIAAVNGPALGFGAAMVLACDFAVANASASLAWPETRWGLAPGLSAPLLSRRLGSRRAAKLLFSGEAIEAEYALQTGLFDQLCPDSLLWVQAHETAKRCQKLSPNAIAITKRLLNETIEESLFAELSVGAANTAASRTTLEAMEGVDAFVNKRQPSWA